MEVVDQKLLTFLIYQQIIQDTLSEAKRYASHGLTEKLSIQYLKIIDDLIKCINEKHEKEFFFDRIHHGTGFQFRSIFLAEEEEEEDEHEPQN